MQKIKLKRSVHYLYQHLHDYYDSKIYDCDLVVISGAGTLKWDVRVNFGPYYDIISKCAEKYGVNCIVNSVGIESEYSETDYRSIHFSKVLSKDVFKYITTRDSIEQLRKYVKNDHTFIDKVIDPGVFSADVYNIKKDSDSEIIGIGIITYHRFEQFHRKITKKMYEKCIQEIIDYYQSKGIDYVLFTNGEEEDNDYARYLQEKFCPETKLLTPNSPEELVKIIAGFKGIITSRLHSCIVAYSLNIPFVNICWNNKNKYFCENIGCSNRCIDYDRLDYKIINNELYNAFNNGYDLDFQIKSKEDCLKLFDRYLNFMR